MSEGSSGWQSDAVASAGMRLTVACMESSAQIAALELVTASSMRVLCFLAVFGDTISFSLLLNEGAQRLHHGQDVDQDVSTVPASRPRHETKESPRQFGRRRGRGVRIVPRRPPPLKAPWY